MKKFIIAALAVIAATASYAQVDPNRVVAVVNGDEIKGSEYYHRMEYLPGVGKRMGNAFSEFPPGFLTIEQLITEKLVFQLAKNKGVMPTDMEVDAEYQARKVDTPNMDALWLSSGRSLEELKYQIQYELAQFNVQTFGVTITNQEVDDYFTKHPDEFTVPKKYQLRVIVVKSEADKSAVDSALAANKAFSDVATQYSADVTKAAGGEYGSIPDTMLGQSVRSAVAATKIGTTTDWIPTQPQPGQTAYVKFLVENIEAPKKLALDAALRRRIRRKLMMDAGSVKNNIGKDMKALRADSKIDIKQPEFKEAYDKFIQAYLKQGG